MQTVTKNEKKYGEAVNSGIMILGTAWYIDSLCDPKAACGKHRVIRFLKVA